MFLLTVLSVKWRQNRANGIKQQKQTTTNESKRGLKAYQPWQGPIRPDKKKKKKKTKENKKLKVSHTAKKQVLSHTLNYTDPVWPVLKLLPIEYRFLNTFHGLRVRALCGVLQVRVGFCVRVRVGAKVMLESTRAG